MIKFLKNSRGFSLVELVVAVGISGVVALAASKMMSDTYKNQSYIETMADINKVMATVQGIYANKTNCNFLFNQTFASTQSFVTPVNIGSVKVPVATGSVPVIQIGDYGKYKITKIEVVNSPTNNIRIKDIVLTFVWAGRPYLSTATIEKRISVFAEVDPGQDGVVDATDKWACGGIVRDSKIESQKALCLSLDPTQSQFAVWDAPTSKCNIKQFKCPPGQVPFALSSLGNVLCEPTQDAIDLWSVTDPTPVACPSTTSQIKVVFTSGKYRLVCGGGCTPTDSNWGAWSGWSACSGGTQYRTKTCTGAVACGGTNNCTGCSGVGCPGTTREYQTCGTLPDGTWCATTSGCIGNICSDCQNPPSNTCGALGQGTCGQVTNCSPVWNCL